MYTNSCLDAAIAMNPMNQSIKEEEQQEEIRKPNLLEQTGTSK